MSNPLSNDGALLQRVASEHGVASELLTEAIELELSFHRSGRRRGLFPALREIVSRAARTQQVADDPD